MPIYKPHMNSMISTMSPDELYTDDHNAYADDANNTNNNSAALSH